MRGAACGLLVAALSSLVTAAARSEGIDQWRPAGALEPQALVRPRLAPRDDDGLESFVTELMSEHFVRHRLVGAAVAIVDDQGLVFAGGYGHDDVARTSAVDPGRTIFRVASLSKPVTWVAVMQLVERGLLGLDDAVDSHLRSLPLERHPAGAVTVRNLMTHSAGFEDGAIGYLFRHGLEQMPDIAATLRRHRHALVMPPTRDFSDGRGVAYSNWGTALAGVLVEDVTGLSFHDYVESAVLQPLGMASSSFREPPPTGSGSRVAVGHRPQRGGMAPLEFAFASGFAPAASLSSSVLDLSRLAGLLLGSPPAEGEGVLSATTTERMLARSLSPHPHLPGMTLGLYEHYLNGWRTVGHGGSMPGFRSSLTLVPDAGVALVLLYNSEAGAASGEFRQGFMDRYFPATGKVLHGSASLTEGARGFSGTYRSLRRSHTRIDKARAALRDIRVVVLSPSELRIGPLFGETSTWWQVAPDTFRQSTGDSLVVFARNTDGRVTHLMGPFPGEPAERLAWWQAARVHLGLAAVAWAGLLGGTLICVSARRKWIRFSKPRRGRPGVVIALFLVAAHFAITASTWHVFVTGADQLVRGLPAAYRYVLWLPQVAIVATLLALVESLRIARVERGVTWPVVGTLLVVFASTCLLALMAYWNLLGASYDGDWR